MQSILQLSETIRRCKPDHIPVHMGYFLGDLFKILKNINETSLHEDDRIERLHELRDKYGIPIEKLI